MEEREAVSSYFVGEAYYVELWVGEACSVAEKELWIAVLKPEQDGIVGEPDQND